MKPRKFNQPSSQTLFENRLPENDPKAAKVSTAVRSVVEKSLAPHGPANLTLFEESISIPNNLLPEVRSKIDDVLGSDSGRYVVRPEGERLILERKKEVIALVEVPKGPEVVVPVEAPKMPVVVSNPEEKDKDPQEEKAEEWAKYYAGRPHRRRR